MLAKHLYVSVVLLKATDTLVDLVRNESFKYQSFCEFVNIDCLRMIDLKFICLSIFLSDYSHNVSEHYFPCDV